MTEYREIRPEREWTRWVECGWCSETGDDAQPHVVRPDGCVDIVYSCEEGLRAVGAMTAQLRYVFEPGKRMAGVRFQPGMATAFLGAAASEFTDQAIGLEQVWGARARELERRLRDARTPGETVRLLLEGIPKPQREPSPVQRAIQEIAAHRGNCDLEWAARQARLSERQFRRRCLEESGLAPKQLSRVLRFRFACELADRGERWPAIAADCGYFDQAHLIRDFHEFAGAAPMAVFSNTGDRGMP